MPQTYPLKRLLQEARSNGTHIAVDLVHLAFFPNFFDRNHMETIWMGAPKRHMHLAAPHVDGASRVAVAARAWWGSRSRD